jgi:hypothetical protein
MGTSNQCADCALCGADPDGLYCGHETSLKGSCGFGWSPAAARSDGQPCGPQAVHFVRASDEVLQSRGRSA